MIDKKRSFFEKLTGNMQVDDDYDIETSSDYSKGSENISMHPTPTSNFTPPPSFITFGEQSPMEDLSTPPPPLEEDGELTVDIYKTPTEIVVETMIAGVRPEDITINITRDMLTIKGKREENKIINKDDYFAQELYWGSFSRTILLPQEVDPEGAEAIEKHGLLIVRMPRSDKAKHTSVKVKSI